MRLITSLPISTNTNGAEGLGHSFFGDQLSLDYYTFLHI